MKSRLIVPMLLSVIFLGGFASTARAVDTPTETQVKDVAVPLGGIGGAAMGAAGGSTAVGAAAATGIGGAVVAGAAAGAVLGIGIEHATGAGSKAGEWLYEHSNRKTAGEAVDSFDHAKTNWQQGEYLDAIGDGAKGIGKMVEGFID
jgi:hypothetical protein